MVGSAKARMVRLTFHDCVGGCDGCLNVNDPDNAGLEVRVQHSTPEIIIKTKDSFKDIMILASRHQVHAMVSLLTLFSGTREIRNIRVCYYNI